MKNVSIMAHDMVPEHIIIDEDEIKEVAEKYNVDREHLPKLKADDPVAKEIGAQPGDVVKIVRESKTAGKSVAYRYVI